MVMAHYAFEKKYTGKIYPGVKINQIDLSGLTNKQAIKLLNQKIDQFNQNGIIFLVLSRQLRMQK